MDGFDSVCLFQSQEGNVVTGIWCLKYCSRVEEFSDPSITEDLLFDIGLPEASDFAATVNILFSKKALLKYLVPFQFQF